MLLLAQAAPDSIKSWLEAFFWLIAGLGGVLGCLVALKNLRAKDPTTPQPLVVQEHAVVVTQAQLDQVHGRIKRERMEMDEKIAELKAEDKILREKLDNEIENLQDRVDAVPGRVIEMLRITKGLIS